MMSISDSLLVDRALPHVPPPLWAPMSTGTLFNRHDGSQPSILKTGKKGTQSPINIDSLRVHLMKEGRIKLEDAYLIISTAEALFKEERNVLQLREPVTVVGDIHGQFYDLIKLLEIGGNPQNSGDNKGTTYLFLGDYVDRGCFSCECIILLFAMKICYPQTTFMIRGNHEARHLTTYFNFKEECLFKYNSVFYDHAIAAFDAMPLAAMVGNRFFCVHGGLSPDVTHVEDILHIYRFREIPSSGAMCDLLWSDPHWDVENPAEPSSDGYYNFSAVHAYEIEPSFTPNDQRGCSYVFNFACLKHFITENNILCVVRAHEAQDEGYKLYRSHPNTHFPAMISIFSAPNYCDTYDNKGAIAILSDGKMNLKQYFSSPHPYCLPNFMNAFTWSLPFVLSKIVSALDTILRISMIDEAIPQGSEGLFELDPEDEKEVQSEMRALGIDEALRGVKPPKESSNAKPGLSVKAKVIGMGMVAQGLQKRTLQ